MDEDKKVVLNVFSFFLIDLQVNFCLKCGTYVVVVRDEARLMCGRVGNFYVFQELDFKILGTKSEKRKSFLELIFFLILSRANIDIKFLSMASQSNFYPIL